MNWDDPLPDFTFVLFKRWDPMRNIDRFYFVSYQDTLIGPAVVRVWGRVGGHQHQLQPTPFPTLNEAWPLIRSVIKARLRHGYVVVAPLDYKEPYAI